MENINNSCLMMACDLETPVGLSSVIDDEDLVGNGIELDSHITLIYAQGIEIPKARVMSLIKENLSTSDVNSLMSALKEKEFIGDKLFDHFELSVFKNDSDFLILKLKEDAEMYNIFVSINEIFKDEYNVPANYTYTPHITLAELVSGTGDKYLTSDKLNLVLEHSLVSLEDLIISYGSTGEIDRLRFNLTTFHAVERYFRELNLKLTEV